MHIERSVVFFTSSAMPIGCITSALLRSSSLKLLPPAAIVRQASSTCSSLSANERLWRSFLYVPGDQEKKVSKIANLCDTHRISPDIPDVVVLDFEDGVSSENKVGTTLLTLPLLK